MEDKITAILKDEFLSADIADQDLNANLGNVVKIVEKDYNGINNKPQINGVTLQGNKSALELGLVPTDLSELDAVEQPTKSVRQTADMFVDNGGKPSKIALQQVKGMATKVVYADELGNVDFEKLDIDDYVILGDKIYRVVNAENNIKQLLPETSAEHVTFADKKGEYTSTNVEDALTEIAETVAENNENLTSEISGVGTLLTNHKNDKDNPHGVTKTQVGLGNVDNTADLDKPISNAQRTVNAGFENNFEQLNSNIDTLGEGLNERIDTTNSNLTALRESTESALSNQQESINDIDSTLNSHITNQSNPHNVTKAQVGLDQVDNTADIDKSVKEAKKATNDGVGNNIVDTYASKQYVQEGLAGKSRSIAFEDYQAFVTAVNSYSNTTLKVSDNVFVKTLGVPDMWVTAVNSEKAAYTYTNDQTIVNALNTTNGLTVGYYTFSQLETTKVDLTNYQQKTDGGLDSTNKTIVGAINEVKGTADNALSKANTNATEISQIKDGTTKVKDAEHADTTDNATQADSASKVANNLTFSGQNAQGTESTIGFDGSQAQEVAFNRDDFVTTKGNAFEVSIAPSGATAGTYNNVTVDEKGRVTTGENIDYATMAQVNAKQNALTEEQLAAVNSGITEAKRAKYDGYDTTINQKANSADLATVATSGSYNDLSNKPAIPTNYVTTDTTQNNISGRKTFTTTIVKKSNTIDLTTPTSGTQWNYIEFTDKNDDRIGIAGSRFDAGGYAGIYLQARNGQQLWIASSTPDSSGNTVTKTSAPTPPNKDNSTQIATTAWAGRRYKSIADFGFTSKTTVKAIVQKIIDNWYEFCTFACTNDNFNNFSDTPDGYGTLVIEVGSNALRPLISFTKQIGDSNSYKNWQANIVRDANNQVTEIQWYEIVNANLPQTISGAKTFTKKISISTNNTPDCSLIDTGLENGTNPTVARGVQVIGRDKNNLALTGWRGWVSTTGYTSSHLYARSFGTDYSSFVAFYGKPNATASTNSNIWYFAPSTSNNIDLGASGQRWNNGYITNLQLCKVINGGGGNSLIQQNSDTDGADITVGSTGCNLKIQGKGARPTYRQGASGTYANLALQSDIPTVNNGTLTIQKNGTNVATFTANQSGNSTANIEVPTALSDLENDIKVLKNNTDQSYSLSIAGSNNLNSAATATYCTAIGSGASARYTKTIKIGTGLTPDSQSVTQIGTGAYTSSGRALYLGAGNSGYTYMNAPGSSWTSASDIRDKTDIEEIDHALDFIKKLKPITYVMNDRERYLIKDENDNPILDENGKQQYDVEAHKRGDKKKHRRFAGLSAQDTYQAMLDCYDNDKNYAQIVDNNKFDHPDDEYIEQYCMSYERLVPFLIKAMQEQQEQIEQLKSRLGE